MNYALLGDIVAVFYDEVSNFNAESTQLKIGKELFKEVAVVHSKQEFTALLERFSNRDQKFLFFVHLFHSDGKKGFFNFRNSKIAMEYPDLLFHYISSAPKNLMHQDGESYPVYSYDNFHELVGSTFKPQKKAVIMGLNFEAEPRTDSKTPNNPADFSMTIPGIYPKVQYAIITAMYQDEFEEIEGIIEWEKSLDIMTGKNLFRMGHLKGQPTRKVVAANPSSTGMIDISILATQILEFFRPDFILMPGVCGGKPGSQFGDIIVAKKVITFQKGKVSDVKDKQGNPLVLYDQSRNAIDYTKLEDIDGNQISISIEKFEIEHDGMPEIHSVVQALIEPAFENIKYKINQGMKAFNKNVNIYFDTMACSTMVINKKGYFEYNIKPADRKVVGVEMESDGVARAAQFANHGLTKFIIAKSVMDNMTEKNDAAKRLAAYTSAQFIRHLLHDGILEKLLTKEA